MTRCWCKTATTPVGRLKLVASDRGLTAVLWEDDDPLRVRTAAATERADHPLLLAAESQLAEYFVGRRRTFDVPTDVVGTPFQQKVWRVLAAIPFGQTRSYGDLARTLGDAKAVRAVGAANGRNPLSIVWPCHRVIGSGGKLTGFAGGLAIKAFLLAHEAGDGLFTQARLR